jgi:hypothetical protein
MRVNAVLLQKALTSFSSAIYYLAQSIEPEAEDIVGYNAYLKSREAAQNAAPRKPAKLVQSDHADDMKALKADLAKEERRMASSDREDGPPAAKPAKAKVEPARQDRSEAGLPDKPMKQASMEEYLKGWVQRAKVHQVKSLGGFAVGMGCSFQGVEHAVRALYSNGVALVNRRATQYQRLVPVENLECLFLRDSGSSGKYAPGQKVEVGYGMKDSDRATSFRPATIVSIYGQSAQIRYSDTEATSSAKLSHLRPSR